MTRTMIRHALDRPRAAAADTLRVRLRPLRYVNACVRHDALEQGAKPHSSGIAVSGFMPLHGFLQSRDFKGRLDDLERQVTLIRKGQSSMQSRDARSAHKQLRRQIESSGYNFNSAFVAEPFNEPFVEGGQLLVLAEPYDDVAHSQIFVERDPGLHARVAGPDHADKLILEQRFGWVLRSEPNGRGDGKVYLTAIQGIEAAVDVGNEFEPYSGSHLFHARQGFRHEHHLHVVGHEQPELARG